MTSISGSEVSVNQKELDQRERSAILQLAKEGKFYRLKADVVGSDGIKRTFLTSSKACHLLQSQLHDFLTISFDHNNAVLGINLKAVNLDSATDDCDGINLNVNQFSTVVTLKSIEIAPTPDTANFVQKLEREKEARERGESKDNRSFIQKYWM